MQDTAWSDVYLSDVPHVVYQVADPDDTHGAQHATLVNKGNEAMGYLQFIIDYYDRLPISIAFIHGGRYASHLSPSSVQHCAFVHSKAYDLGL